MSDHDSFHAGERAVQQRAGETAMAERHRGVFSDTVIAGARTFIARQFMLALASVDAAGNVWASLLFGQPGFLRTEDGSSIAITVPEQQRNRADPVWENIARQPALGMLFIDLGSRRRYRVNGAVRRLDAHGVEVAIHVAYPNCPKYIQRRQLRQAGEMDLPEQIMYPAHGTLLSAAAARIVGQADTIFVASHHAESGADATHRGGRAGFVKVVNERTLRIPDFSGNGMFNTLGNFAIDPRAGLCIPDFEHGHLLQLTGSAVICWDQDDPGNETGGTGRYWEFTVARWSVRNMPQRLVWEYPEASPFNP